MDQYHLNDENLIHSEMHNPGFSESQGLNCSDTLNLKLSPDTRDIMYTGLSSLDTDPSLSAGDMANDTLEDNLDALSLCSVKDCDFVKLLDESDFDSQLSLCELGLPVPAAPKEVEQGGKSNSDSARKGKHQHSSPQNPLLDCSLCGKVFSSASSLSKHYLTHSQERKYVCKICSKAFKRQDHLNGHMLTHQKTKPFMCIEQGCSKSYCDHRSLLRHYEMQHGLYMLKEATCDEDACEVLSPSHDASVQIGQGSMKMERLAVHSESKSPNPVLPNRDLLRCIVSNFVNQKLPSTPASSAGQSDTDLKGSLQFCSSAADQVSCIPSSTTALFEATGDNMLKEHYPFQKNATSSNVYAIINPGNLSVITPGEDIINSLTDRSLLSEPQFPLETTRLEYWPNSTLPCFPLFRGQKISANSSHQSSCNFQWIRNMPVCTKSKGNSVYITHNPCVAAQDISGGLAGPSRVFDSFAQMYECPDAVSFAPAFLKTQGEISDKTKLSSFEETFRPTKRQEYDIDSYQWQDIQKQSVLQNNTTPLFRQLFMDSSVNQEHVQVQQHLLQMFTKSQHILSHTHVVAPSQQATSEVKQTVAKPLQNVLQQQQQTDVIHSLLERTEHERSPIYMQKTLTQYQKDVSSSSEKQGQIGRQQAAVTFQSFQSLPDPFINTDTVYFAKQTRPLKGCVGFKDIANSSQPPPTVCDKALGNSYGKSSQLENNTLVYSKKEKSEGYCKGTGGKLYSSSGRPRRLPSVRKEKLKFDLSSTASPSQVAMASFSLPGTSPSQVTEKKHKLTIFNRIQGGNIYSLTNAVREENLSAGCNQTSGVPADGNKYASGFVCKTCGQLFYTEKGLNSHMCFHSEQWHSSQGKIEQQVNNAENLNSQKLSLKSIGDENTPSEIKRALEDVTVAPLVIPVSVPVTAVNQQTRNKVNEKESQDEMDLRERLPQRKRKRQTRAKSLFIPPPSPLCAEMQPGMGGCHESNLRSPIYLVDHVLRDLFQCSPYTPPPMLSPIREGSGLYFSTLCSSSTNSGPNKLYSTILDRMDGDFGFSLVKDNTKISIKPHINVGNRFQAEIPHLQDRAFLENDEHAESLVWKPWGDIATNQETQDRVTELLNVACSSAMPGGGTNLELALHCLHEAQGNILEALEILLFRGPQKPPSHPLADYGYAGSDIWTPVEKQLFKKAFCLHKKDFYLIQKKIQTKNVSQCVEYYYNWKKIIKFDCSRAKIACSPKKRHGYLPKQDMKIKSENYKKASHRTYNPACSQRETPDQPENTDCQGAFPCKECERVFDKIKSRNAHMKCHRQQESMDPLIKIKWPIKH